MGTVVARPTVGSEVLTPKWRVAGKFQLVPDALGARRPAFRQMIKSPHPAVAVARGDPEKTLLRQILMPVYDVSIRFWRIPADIAAFRPISPIDGLLQSGAAFGIALTVAGEAIVGFSDAGVAQW